MKATLGSSLCAYLEGNCDQQQQSDVCLYDSGISKHMFVLLRLEMHSSNVVDVHLKEKKNEGALSKTACLNQIVHYVFRRCKLPL